jgi:DNA polymerase III delta prime subunit
MIDKKFFTSMLFYGEPGTGKTSAARILGNAAGEWAFQEINGSSVVGVEFVRTRIARIASSVAMFGGQKICFIDEAEYVSPQAQDALRKVIEDYSGNCCFLFAVNDISKITDALRSRLTPAIDFDLAASSDRAEVKQSLLRRYADVLTREGVPFDEERLDKLIGRYYRDHRKLANELQYAFAYAGAPHSISERAPIAAPGTINNFPALMRPRQFADLTLPQPDIDRLQCMYDDGNIMNMLFYGKPGFGKTSTARLFGDRHDLMEINGSEQTGVDFVEDDVRHFAMTYASNDRLKILFIDEAENLSKKAQAALRKVIEGGEHAGGLVYDYELNCRFILAVNDRRKLLPALRSRLKQICFENDYSRRSAIQWQLVARFEAALSERGITYNHDRLHQLAGIYHDDLRALAKIVEWEFA